MRIRRSLAKRFELCSNGNRASRSLHARVGRVGACVVVHRRTHCVGSELDSCPVSAKSTRHLRGVVRCDWECRRRVVHEDNLYLGMHLLVPQLSDNPRGAALVPHLAT